jgi:hypothetical protein
MTMGKYTNLEQDVYSVFSSNEWKAEDIKTFPTNFVVMNATNDEFIRVSVIPSGNPINRYSLAGVLIIDIFTAAGGGTRRASIIADTLDSYLVNKSKSTSTGVTQFGISSLLHNGVDKASPILHKSTYTITFNFYGSST